MFRIGLLCVAGSLTLASCTSISYTAPDSAPEKPENSVVVNAGYDETWTRLIDMLSQSFYSIELLDKDSGFIRLGFVSSAPARYVDCGMVDDNGQPPYRGPLATYMRMKGADFAARMNVFVKPVGTGRTMVRVHARYVFGSYVFETGGVATEQIPTPKGPQNRVCQPTHAAEDFILGAAADLVSTEARR